MKIKKNAIRLSPEHPSCFLDLPPEEGLFAPILVDSSGLLVDGYRRYRIQPDTEIEAVELNCDSLFEAAYAMNLRTRSWDDLDCFFWDRWARSLGVTAQLRVNRFPSELQDADPSLLSLLAARRLTLRQAALILQSPMAYRPFFQRYLSQCVALNNNETAVFMDHCRDLKKLWKLERIEAVVERVEEGGLDLDARRRGERLLKAMRVLRYPYYQRSLTEFAESWSSLELGPAIQVDKSRFLERGKLELTITTASYQETQENLVKLAESKESPHWRKIWEK